VGYGDLSSYGAPTTHTPRLDRLASEGIRFTQWYAGAAVCTPSRGATLTGRLPLRSGLYSRFNYPFDYLFRVFYPSSLGSLPANETTIAGALKEKGYYSAAVGKWHLGHHNALPHERGFDYFYGTPYSHDEGYPGPFPMSLVWPPVPLYQNEKIIEQPLDLETLTPRMTSEALNVIETSHAAGQPFFLYLSYHEAHIPIFTSKEFEGVSRRGRYGDMMVQMDSSVGQVIDKLKELQIDNNTLVIFVSDNGAWVEAKEPFSPEGASEFGVGGSNGPFREGKGSTWEGGIRVPAIAWWPGRIQPALSFEMATHLDLLPTFLELAGIQPPADRVLDGKSIAPLLLDTTQKSPHEFLFFWREQILMAVRYGAYKLHYVTRSGFGFDRPVVHDPPLLFNIEVDPGELFPLNSTHHQDIVDAIHQASEAHKATIELGSPQYDFKHEGPVPGQDWSVIPCCRRDFSEEREEDGSRAAFPPDDWSLIIWKNCICRRFPKDIAAAEAEAVFRPADEIMRSSFMGFQLLDYDELLSSLPSN